VSIGFLFPGQGSQAPGMLHELPQHPAITRTLDEASEILASDVLQLDSADALQSTISVQLALLASGVAGGSLEEEGIVAEAVAGLSIGAFGGLRARPSQAISTSSSKTSNPGCYLSAFGLEEGSLASSHRLIVLCLERDSNRGLQFTAESANRARMRRACTVGAPSKLAVNKRLKASQEFRDQGVGGSNPLSPTILSLTL
jgi:hypothetical protein